MFCFLYLEIFAFASFYFLLFTLKWFASSVLEANMYVMELSKCLMSVCTADITKAVSTVY